MLFRKEELWNLGNDLGEQSRLWMQHKLRELQETISSDLQMSS